MAPVLVGRPRLGEPALLHSLEKIFPDRVNRMAGLSQQERIALYQSADLFVFPSLYDDIALLREVGWGGCWELVAFLAFYRGYIASE